MTGPVPVLRCDICGTVTHLASKGTRHSTAQSEEQRLDELRDQGWLISPERDLCPQCAPIHRDKTGTQQ